MYTLKMDTEIQKWEWFIFAIRLQHAAIPPFSREPDRARKVEN